MLARLRKTVAIGGAVAALLIHGSAAADVMFSGAGTWADDAAITSLSAPNTTWSLAFALPSTVGASTTSAISGFSYRLAGVSVATSPSAITFYAAADGGMFDIAFTGSSASLSLYGDPVLSGSTLSTGSYAVFAGISGSQPVGAGTLVLVPVPEPATWAFFALGFAGIVALRRPGTVRAAPVRRASPT